MGLSIHYSGTITQLSKINLLVDELEDICKSLGWQYHIWNGKGFEKAVKQHPPQTKIDFSLDELKGITMRPEKCEPVDVVFFPTGSTCSPVKVKFNTSGTDELMVQTVSTKTQFAGIDVHKTVVDLFIYLQPKYFSSFKMSDEGEYWETRDEKILLQQFARYNFLLDKLTTGLKNFKAAPGETASSLADRLEEYLKKKFDDET